MSFALKLSGRSGCEIGLVSKNERLVVRKYAKNVAYNKRLLQQANKQSQFLNHFTSDFFTVPKILDSYHGSDNELAWIEMEYIHAEKYSDFLERISVPDLIALATTIRDYFEKALLNSRLEQLDNNVFIEKWEILAAQLIGVKGLNQDLLRKTFLYLKNIPSYPIVIGYCHGDFTFSNVLFEKNQCYLIDFLDSFVESPIQDIVKLRQDTFYGWSMMLEEDMTVVKYNKLKQVMCYLDRTCLSIIEKHPEIKRWYAYLQVFNLLRILPYLKHQREISFVEEAIEKTI
jgi:Phosphotransferase enzyme family